MTAEAFLSPTISVSRSDRRETLVAVTAEKRRPFFQYSSFAGKPGSSSQNWVPADYLVSRLADMLHISDEDLKKKG